MRLFSLALIATGLLFGCTKTDPSPAPASSSSTATPAPPPEKTVLTLKGSDTMVILGQRWAETYMNANPGVSVQVTGGGSGTGIAALINGTTDICEASRPMKDKEKDDTLAKRGAPAVEIKVALDALAVYVNEKNPIKRYRFRRSPSSTRETRRRGKTSAAPTTR